MNHFFEKNGRGEGLIQWPWNPLAHANILWLNRSKVEMSKRVSAQKGYVYTLDRDGRFWETTHFLVDINFNLLRNLTNIK